MTPAQRVLRQAVGAWGERPEWSEDGLVNNHEVGQALDEISPTLLEVFDNFPGGWNITARRAFKSALIDLVREMDEAGAAQGEEQR